MKDYHNHIISFRATIKEGLIKINGLVDQILCLFVVDDDKVLIGTLTDGDIRRALISGISLDNPIVSAMKRNFVRIQGDVTPFDIRDFRAKGVNILPCIDNSGKIIKIYNLLSRQSVLPVDAVLMAGGKGLRLRPLTEKIPKPLLKVGDKAIIDYNIERLVHYGVENIHVNVNYLHEQIEAHFRSVNNGVNIECILEPRFLGTMGSVKFITNFAHETVLVMNSDLFTNIDFEEFYINHIEKEADVSVAAIPYSVSVPYGIFDLEDSRIRGLREKPTFNYYANGGIYLVKHHLFNLIPADTYFDATDFLDLLISKGYKVITFPIIGYWIDIGKHEDYIKVQEFVKYLKP